MVVRSMVWLLLPGAVYGVLASALLSPEPPRWRTAVGRLLRRLGGAWARSVTQVRERTGRLWRRRPARPRTRQQEPDPFDALMLQIRLGQVAAQVRALEADQHAWARGRRMLATQDAYDELLAEACRLAGVDAPEVDPQAGIAGRDPERFREEMELASRGWSW